MSRLFTSLPALACFRAAAECESFSKAADRLNLTHGAVSRAVRLIEADLGVALFARRNRAVFLTEEGRLLARAVAQGLGHIEAAAQEIIAQQSGRAITLSCEPTLMMRWLIPRLPGFQRRHPEADLRLLAGGGAVDLGQGIDLALRREDFPRPASYQAHALFEEWIGPVCRPDLAARYAPGGRIDPAAPRLYSQTRRDAWALWSGLAGQGLPAGGQSFEHFYFTLQAAVAGLGVAIGPWRLVKDDLAAGLLVAPCGFLRDGSRYVLLRPGARPGARPAPDPAEARVLDWLRDLAAQDGQP